VTIVCVCMYVCMCVQMYGNKQNYGVSWTTRAFGAQWFGAASDSTGQYLAAVYSNDGSNGFGGYVCTSSVRMYSSMCIIDHLSIGLSIFCHFFCKCNVLLMYIFCVFCITGLVML